MKYCTVGVNSAWIELDQRTPWKNRWVRRATAMDNVQWAKGHSDPVETNTSHCMILTHSVEKLRSDMRDLDWGPLDGGPIATLHGRKP